MNGNEEDNEIIKLVPLVLLQVECSKDFSDVVESQLASYGTMNGKVSN